MTSACFECGEFFKSRAEARPLISAAGLSGHVVSCHVCSKCFEESRKRGASGPNVTAAAYGSANAARVKRDTTPLAQLGWGKRGGG